jgi:hypothetical protein
MAGLLLGAVFSSAGCDTVRPPRLEEGRCNPEHPCDEGQVCIPRQPGGLAGFCVPACPQGQGCPEETQCTGRYQRIGSVDRFCRRPVQGAGQRCAHPAKGCGKGLRCFQGRCVSTCESDTQCPQAAQRCLPVVADTMVDEDRETIFSACLPTTQREGQPCKASGPFCRRGLVCHDDKCVETCATAGDCGKGRVCDGALYRGPKRKARAARRAEPDVRYCREAARRGQPCHHNLDVGCAKGLACIKFRCRKVYRRKANRRCDPDRGRFCEKGLLCFEGYCRRPCLQDADCLEERPGSAGDEARAGAKNEDEARKPRQRRRRRRRRHRGRKKRGGADRKRECVEKTIGGQPVKLCL